MVRQFLRSSMTAGVSAVFLSVVVVEALTISGTITEAGSNKPLAGAEVILRHGKKIGGQGAWNTEWKKLEEIATGDDGSYSFTGLAPTGDKEVYMVTVMHNGYNAKKTASFTLDKDLVENFSLIKHTWGGLSLKILDNKGNPVSGASVSAEQLVTEGEMYLGYTDGLGNIKHDKVVAGDYRVIVFLKGFALSNSQANVKTDEMAKIEISLQVSDEIGKVVIGTLKDNKGNPVSGEAVVLKFGSSANRVNLFDLTNNSGAFIISGIPVSNAAAKAELDFEGYEELDTIFALSGDTTYVNLVMFSDGTSEIINRFNGNTLSAGNFYVVRKGGLLSVTGFGKGEYYRVEFMTLNGRIIHELYFTASDHSHVFSAPAAKQPVLINIRNVKGASLGVLRMF